MARIPTMKVMPWSQTQGEYVLINECDFDPRIHDVYDPEKKKHLDISRYTKKQMIQLADTRGIHLPDDVKTAAQLREFLGPLL